MHYRDLLAYKLKFSNLLSHNSGIYETSYPYLFSQLATRDISNSIKQKIRVIDTSLALLIDPKKRHFSEEDLVKKYGYPTDDLGQIDEDWM
jgi:hypothetical protein